MLIYSLPIIHASQHTAIQDSFVNLLENLKWVLVTDWRRVTPGYAVEEILARYTSQERVLVLIGNDRADWDKLRVVVAYVTEEFTNDELFNLLQEALREVVGVEIWEQVTLSA